MMDNDPPPNSTPAPWTSLTRVMALPKLSRLLHAVTPTPTKISLMMDADSSPLAAAPRAAPSASNSSTNRMAGAFLRMRSNVSRMRRAPTPEYTCGVGQGRCRLVTLHAMRTAR